jgi:hypothetical protein
MVTHRTLDVQIHDPAKGPFTPQFDPSFSMMTGTRPMRVGKTGDTGRRSAMAETLAEYMAEHKPATSRQYNTRVKTRFRKNLLAGLL